MIVPKCYRLPIYTSDRDQWCGDSGRLLLKLVRSLVGRLQGINNSHSPSLLCHAIQNVYNSYTVLSVVVPLTGEAPGAVSFPAHAA